MRKLATVRRIDEINPIENADAIEVATIGGWKVVVKKGQLQAGELAIFFEIDSFLPDEPVYEFLKNKKTLDGREGYRLRTIKLRGQISQGLVLPLSDFPQFNDIVLKEDDDVSEWLNVVKWELPEKGFNPHRKGNFPHFIRKTDEERIQNIKVSDLEAWQNEWFVETIKIDGSSMTVYGIPDFKLPEDENAGVDQVEYFKVGVCSRNQEVSEGSKFWEQAKRYKIPERLQQFYETENRKIAIQGELFGEGIQKNRWKLEGNDFRVFNIWDIDRQQYVGFDELMNIITTLNSYFPKDEQLQTVQVLRVFHLADMGTTRQDFLDRADELFDKGTVPVEGVVYKTNDFREDGAISFKAISNKYLLAIGE